MKKTLRQKAYRSIKDKIIHFELKPGERILESRISRDLKLGRMPVREALAILESEKLLTRAEGYGYVIKKMNEAEVEDHFKIRANLECVGAEMLIKRATDADIRRMKKHIEKAVEIYKGDEILKIIQSDTKFHDMMYRSTKSEVLYETITSLTDKMIIMRAAALQIRIGREMGIKDHINIVAAMEKRDLKKLQALLCEHLDYAHKNYESIRPFICA